MVWRGCKSRWSSSWPRCIAKQQQLDARAKQLTDRQKALDLRRRAKGEKVLLQLVLARIAERPEFKTALLDQLASATLRPEDREAALWLLAPATPKAGDAANAA